MTALPLVRAVYQPVVDLDTRAVVGFEALARGPLGSLHTPDALFRRARAEGRLIELDWACRAAALRGALAAGLPASLELFVNVEPAAILAPAPDDVVDVLAASGQLSIVLEITERALLADPAALLRAADQARERGWRIAVDDVGAERASLALLPFLRPDVIKLDLRLVQAHTTVDTAEIITAVNAEAERTGAVVLAEGLETEDHASLALMLGARLGQGWLFGRPGALAPASAVPAAGEPERSYALLRRPAVVRAAARHDEPAATPYRMVEGLPGMRRSTKPLLVAISRQLERQALAMGDSAVVLATFQHARNFPASTARRYATLASSSPFVAAFGEGFDDDSAPGVRGVPLPSGDALIGDWDVVVVGPHFAGALLSRDLGDSGPDAERRFDYSVTYDRPTVLRAAVLLMRAVPAETATPTAAPDRVALPRRQHRASAHRLDAVLTAAVVAAPHGVSVADAQHDDAPLVWINKAFTDMTGYDVDSALDRNCRFLQGPDTDPETVRAIRDSLPAGRAVRTTLLNRRRDGTRFWNDLQITPVLDPDGAVTHFVGQQSDVTARMHAQRRADHLAYHDGLTGLANRMQLQSYLAAEVSRAASSGTAVALLFLDIDDFKKVNDTFGHAAGDRLLAVLAVRLRSTARSGDLLARVGGDEFVLVVSGLRERPDEVAMARAADVLAALRRPLAIPDVPAPVPVCVSIGVSVFPQLAADPQQLLDHADAAMYSAKTAGGHRAELSGRALDAQ